MTDTSTTPDYTRSRVQTGATGVVENEKTSENTEVFDDPML
jgi:hypothetical protein